jgi:hypothetical protein
VEKSEQDNSYFLARKADKLELQNQKQKKTGFWCLD